MDELALLKEFRLEDADPAVAREQARHALLRAVAKHRRTRRRVFVALAFAAAAFLTGAAYGVAHELVVGDPAPQEVREQPTRFGHSAELIPVPHPEDPRLEEARVAAILDSSVGTVYMFSSRNAQGPCASTWIEGDRGYQGRLNMTTVCGSADQSFYALGAQRYGEKEVRLFFGRAGDAAARVALRFEDETVDVPLTGDWFLVELTDSRPEEFLAYDGEERVLEQRVFPPLPAPVAPVDSPQPVTEPRELARIRVRGGEEVSLLVARASGGGYCQTVRSDRRRPNSGCFVARPRPGEIGVSGMNFGGAPGGILLLVGPVGAELATLDLRYEDGRSAPVPLNDGWALYEVQTADYAEGRRPETLVGRDASGRQVAVERLPWAEAGG